MWRWCRGFEDDLCCWVQNTLGSVFNTKIMENQAHRFSFVKASLNFSNDFNFKSIFSAHVGCFGEISFSDNEAKETVLVFLSRAHI